MRILIPTGTFQYDVANGFVRDLAEALSALPGHEVQQAEFKNDTDLWMAMKAFRPDLFIAMQAICCDRPTVAKFPATAWMLIGVDHPSYNFHTRFAQIQAPKTLITSHEPSQLSCLKQLLPQYPRTFLPHAAPSHVPRAREPDLGLCFLGSWQDPAVQWEFLAKKVTAATLKRIRDAVDYAQSQHCADATMVLPYEDNYWSGNVSDWCYALSQVDFFVRLQVRRRVLLELDNAGVGIDIFGSGWQTAAWKHHRVHPAVNYGDALAISARAAGVLSITPAHTSGSHERVLSCLAQGSLCLTSPSSFYVDAGFVPGRDYLTYDPWEPGSLSNAVAQMAACRSSPERIAALPEIQSRIQRDHSANARAQRIIQLAHEHFNLI